MRRYLKLSDGSECEVGIKTSLTTTSGRILRTGDCVQLWSKHGTPYFPAFVCANKAWGEEPHIYGMCTWKDNEKLHEDWIVDLLCNYSDVKSGAIVEGCEMIVEGESCKEDVIEKLKNIKCANGEEQEAIDVAILLVEKFM